MDEAIRILHKQIEYCENLTELFNTLIEVLKKNKSAEVPKLTQKISPAVGEFSKSVNSANEFLKKVGAEKLTDFVHSQRESIQKSLAEGLLKNLENLRVDLKNKTSEASRLLANSKEFVDFNLNIMSQTATNTTYGSTAETGSQSKRKIFEANV